MMRVLTVTLNPAIDETITLDRLVPGAVHRARDVRRNAGGKGVNVASCLSDWGMPSVALGLLGAENPALFEALFAGSAIEDRLIRVPGATRVNLKIVDAEDTTDITLGGAPVSSEQVTALAAEIEGLAGPDTLVVLAGSVPPACPPSIYAELTARLRERGARVLLDSSGAPLELALAATVLPQCLKPNRHELSEWSGGSLDTIADVLAATMPLRPRGAELIVVSLGADGALFLSDEGALLARLDVLQVVSTVGAGDAMVAGLAAAMAEDASLERAARLATAFAVAKLGLAGPHLPEPAAVEALAQQVKIVAVGTTGPAVLGETR
jgi:1-phosphofructokinase